MAKAVILKTNDGIKLVGVIKRNDIVLESAESYFNSCNNNKNEFFNMQQVAKLLANATHLSLTPVAENDWHKHRENFVDIEFPVEDML